MKFTENRQIITPMFLVLVIFLVFSYIWLCSAGKISELPDNIATDYIEMQADAFLNGQTSLLTIPTPLLLDADDPYDHRYSDLWLWDAVLFNGKYYTYWGPVPALFVAGVKALTPAKSMPDTFTFLAFAVLHLLVSLMVLWKAWNLLGRKKPWLLALCSLLIAWANPLPYLLGKAAVYETAIIAGQTFSLSGMLFCISAIGAPKRRKSLGFLILAGSLWTLAFSSRLSLLPPLGFIALLTSAAIAAKIDSDWRKGFGVAFAAIITPMVIGILLLGWYNWTRFGDPLITGQYFQLGLSPMTRDIHPGYISINSYLYLFKPLMIIDRFPFLVSPDNPFPVIPWFIMTPPGPYFMGEEPIAGIIWTLPILIFSLPAMLYAWVQRNEIFNAARTVTPPGINTLTLGWLITSCVGFAMLAAFPLLCFWMATMRYTADFSVVMLHLSCIGILITFDRVTFTGWPKTLLLSLTIVLVVYTVIVGGLLWTESETGFLRASNPELMQSLIKFFQ